MSVHRIRRSGGRYIYEVRWREGGRSGVQRSRSFDRRQDAELFEATRRRASQLGQLSAEVIGSEQTVEAFIEEWWQKYAIPVLAPGTRANYVYPLSKWIVPYLGRVRLRDLSRDSIDTLRASMIAAGAGAPTANRCLGIMQGILKRAVEWRRIARQTRCGPTARTARTQPGDRRAYS